MPGLANLRVVIDDARLLLRPCPIACLERIFVLFPDPWPKARHHKRRIVNPGDRRRVRPAAARRAASCASRPTT